MKLNWRFGRKRSEDELSEELQFHLEQEARKNLAEGMSDYEAWRRARVMFGAMEAVKEDCREQRVGSWLETVWRDLLYGLRLLRKSPGFALVAVAILALGIGANTAIFSAVNAVLLARWPFSHPEKVVFISENTTAKTDWTLVSVANFEDYRRQQKTFSQLALWVAQSVNLTGQDRPDRLVGSFVTADFFSIFEAKPAMGRLFLPGEDQPGASNVAVLSHDAWQTRFGADPKILGRQIMLNNESYAVIGVLPRGYRLPFDSDVFITAQHQTSYHRDRATKELLMMGRVRNDVSPAAAQLDLNTIAQRLADDYPNENAGIGITVTDFRQLLNNSVRMPLLVLLGAVALILLIACANLANLLLARGVQRQREMMVRIALGARRSRIVRQLVSETSLLAVIGGVCGIAVSAWALPLLLRIAPSSFKDVKIAVDFRVLLFSLVLTLLTGLLFGVAPALQLSRVKVAPSLTSGSKGAVAGESGARVKAAFVVCQIAISIVLLVAAGLLIRSFQRLLTVNTGLSPERLLTMEYRLPRNKYTSKQSQAVFHRQLAQRVAQVPGVESSAIVQALPFSGNWGDLRYVPEGIAVPAKGKEPDAYTNLVTPEYFATVGIPLLRGRSFNDQDDAASPPVAIVSRSLADRDFAGQDPLGRTVQLIDSDTAINGRRVTIVGVVGDAKQISLRDTHEVEIYFPYPQQPGIFGTLVVRTAVDPMSLAEPVRQAVWSLDKDQPVWKVRTLAFLIDRDLDYDRLLMTLMSCFGVLAVLLTALGTYGVLSNTVSQRRREIGIRMALGANLDAVCRLVIRQGMKLVMIGTAIGLVAALIGLRLLASVLYGVSALDVTAYAAGCLLMLTVAFTAVYLPARRATRVDPATVLRCE